MHKLPPDLTNPVLVKGLENFGVTFAAYKTAYMSDLHCEHCEEVAFQIHQRYF
jgi:hypothetical protein